MLYSFLGFIVHSGLLKTLMYARPYGSCSRESTIFTPLNLRNSIDWLEFEKGQLHDGLGGERFFYAHDTLLPLLVHNFNRTLSEGLTTSWTDYANVPIVNSGDWDPKQLLGNRDWPLLG